MSELKTPTKDYRLKSLVAAVETADHPDGTSYSVFMSILCNYCNGYGDHYYGKSERELLGRGRYVICNHCFGAGVPTIPTSDLNNE